MRNFLSLLIFITSYSNTFGQITFSLNEFDKGEYVGVKENYCVLKSEPEPNSSTIDTIFDNYQNLSFEVLDDSKNSNFIHVKIIISKWSNGEPDPKTGWLLMPKIISNGKEGWIEKNQLLKYPVPNIFTLNCYKKNNELLNTISKNADWQKLNDKNEYDKSYKGTHAGVFLALGTNFFEIDSMAEATYYLTKSIQILPKKRPYIIRAYAKKNLGDFKGSINDCNAGILIENKIIDDDDPNSSYLSENDLGYDTLSFLTIRGLCYIELKNFSSAIIDLTSAIKEDNENGQLYYFRGTAKYDSGQKSAGCSDFSKAGELGVKDAYETIKKYCQ